MTINDTEPRRTVTVRVKGLDCPDCAASLEKAVRNLQDVAGARLVYSTALLTVQKASDRDIVPELRRLSEGMGYRLVSETHSAQEIERATWWATHRQLAITVTSGVLIAVAFLLKVPGVPIVVPRLLLGASIVTGGYYVAQSGLVALRSAHRLDMNVLMVVAAVGAMVVGEFEEGAVTILLFSLGEFLESRTSDRARNAIQSLMEMAPDEATAVRDGVARVVPVDDLVVGDLVRVRPGERLPVDGRIVEGASDVNQAAITGESIPADVGSGDRVYAGSLNGSGALTIEVTSLAEDRTVARIGRMVAKAQSERAPTQRFVERFARYYTPSVLVLAILVALLPPALGLGTLSEWGYRALVLLVISCPCALVISTPVTVASAVARAARSGILFKGGRHLEALSTVRAMAFDKTGTLTMGEPRIVGGECGLHAGSAKDCARCRDLLAKAAALEARSEHALARAVTRSAFEQGLAGRYAVGENAVAHAGRGIEGQVAGHAVAAGRTSLVEGNGAPPISEALLEKAKAEEAKGRTVVFIQDACCGEQCYISIADDLRDGAADALAEIRVAGIQRLVMLTGDNAYTAESIAVRVGIDEYYAGLLPEEKVSAVGRLTETYGAAAMVGDGVNDAPALAKATVGIAMGAAGTDSALETADVALMGDDLSSLALALRLSRATLRTVRSNVALSLVAKALFLVLAVAGVSTLWMAVVADTGTSLLVTLNGLRMLRFERRRS